jgi:hypothetical protein
MMSSSAEYLEKVIPQGMYKVLNAIRDALQFCAVLKP